MNTISIVNAVHVEAVPTQMNQNVMLRQYHVGYFHMHMQAERYVTTSNGYYHKNTRYNYCVIKEITMELYPRVVREEWFKWIDGRYSYVPKPPVQEIISSYSSCIGRRVDGFNIE